MTLSIDRATSLVLEAGQSGELRSALQAVAESTASDGEPRYSMKVCRALNRLIVCRMYAVPVLQLCHLANVADACTPRRGSYEHLLLGLDRVTGSGFRGWVGAAVASHGWRRPGCEVTDSGVAIRYSDGLFNVGFARMPLLAALFEFLCGTVGYAALDDELSTMLETPNSEAAVRKAVNGIERHLYAYLSENLPGVQRQGKFQALLDHARSAPAAPDLVVDDETILGFWREKSLATDSGDFRLFRSVFDAYMAFLSAIEIATDRDAVARARPVGADVESGEIDVAALLDDAEATGSWNSPLDVLSESTVKFLNQSETTALQRLQEHGPRALKLPWSLARAEIFGDAQARITQAMRRNVEPEPFSQLLACDGAESYADWRNRLADLAERIGRTLQASLHVVLQSKGGDGTTDERLEAAQDGARRAFRRISRQGFGDDAALAGERIGEFESGADALAAIIDQIRAFLRVLEGSGQAETDLDDRFAYDRDIFSDQFLRIYGARR